MDTDRGTGMTRTQKHDKGNFLRSRTWGRQQHNPRIYREPIEMMRCSTYINMYVHTKVHTSNNTITFEDNIYVKILTYHTL